MQHKGLQVKHFKNKVDFRTWLKSNWQQEESVWIKLAKKASSQQSPSYEEAREVAICYGWIDGLINKWDEQFYLIKFSKRRPKSLWSQINREIAETLIKQKSMRKPGLIEVERAKVDGRWAAAYSITKTKPPKWFLDELKQHPKAYAFYRTLSNSQKGMLGDRLHTAKREETKQKRAAEFLQKLKAGKRPI